MNVIASQADAAGVTLRVEIADEVPGRVPLDAEKLAWAVTTLVGNARRYVLTPSRRLGGHAIDVQATIDPAKTTLTIAVRDDGPGIPADTVKCLFVRDGLNVRGAGLSLLLIRDILHAHGGTIDLRSTTSVPGHGTDVRLNVPLE